MRTGLPALIGALDQCGVPTWGQGQPGLGAAVILVSGCSGGSAVWVSGLLLNRIYKQVMNSAEEIGI